MKNSAKIFAFAALFLTALFSNSYAQDATALAAVQSSYTNNTYADGNDHSLTTNVAVNSVVAAKFSALFPSATNQVWAASADNCWVSFLNNGRKAKASFTLQGNMNYIITNFAMENLPTAFSKKISTKYSSYQLFNAIEIMAYGAVVYQAILENSKEFITLKYTSEGIEEIQQVKKK